MPTHINQLSKETSPYLLQHANNPVHWFAWGEAALAAAKEEDKPILVSIGYAACHWCHVMERESFEKEAVAEVMNEHFINIKIDREERPDLDHIYMDAVQAIAGNGGWPLNVFLTPDAKPFYGGTYFPPVPAHGRNSWTDVLLSIADAWKNKREEIEMQAEQLISHIKRSNNFGATKSVIPVNKSEEIFSKDDCILIAENILKNADKEDGGFGIAPKFPQTFCLQYLLQYAHFFKDEKALQHAEFSLQKIINGGIYDQLGGGMARYSTDAKWLAPHFEKMLYDNALLLIVLCDAYQMTSNKFYANAISNTIAFVMKELKDSKGGYYAAIDADSEGVEGKFYVWQKSEIESALGSDAAIYCRYYNVTEEGNWEENNILHITDDAQPIAKEFNISLHEFEKIIAVSNEKLLAIRNKRIRPITDDKILLGWNSLLLTALCRSYAALQIKSYKDEAIELFDFIESSFVDEKTGGYFHTYKNDVAKYPAFLDDYAYYIQACIQLQEITGDQTYLAKAKLLTEFVIEHFTDEESNFFYFTNKEQSDIVVRKLELYDGATPSANAIMAGNLKYLSIVFDIQEWGSMSINMIKALQEAIKKYPTSFSVWSLNLLQNLAGYTEIVVTGQRPLELLNEVLSIFIPNKVLQSSNTEENMPLLAGKDFSNKSLVYLCKDYQCFQPVLNITELKNIIINKLT